MNKQLLLTVLTWCCCGIGISISAVAQSPKHPLSNSKAGGKIKSAWQVEYDKDADGKPRADIKAVRLVIDDVILTGPESVMLTGTLYLFTEVDTQNAKYKVETKNGVKTGIIRLVGTATVARKETQPGKSYWLKYPIEYDLQGDYVDQNDVIQNRIRVRGSFNAGKKNNVMQRADDSLSIKIWFKSPEGLREEAMPQQLKKKPGQRVVAFEEKEVPCDEQPPADAAVEETLETPGNPEDFSYTRLEP